MNPLNKHLPSSPVDWVSGSPDESTHIDLEVDPFTLEKNRGLARRLLSELAPLLPVVASATRNLAGANVWVDAWARQITHSGLSGEDLARALRRLGELDQSRPFDWPAFLLLAQLSRPETRAAWERAFKAAGRLGEKPTWNVLDPLTYSTWKLLAEAGIDLRNPSSSDLEVWHKTMCQLSRRKNEWQKPDDNEGEQVEHKVDHLACLAKLKAALPWLNE
jgi:hypothetical protein